MKLPFIVEAPYEFGNGKYRTKACAERLIAIVPTSAHQSVDVELVVEREAHFRGRHLTARLNGRFRVDHQPVHVEDDGIHAHDARMLYQSGRDWMT